jgi:hypothetical protein
MIVMCPESVRAALPRTCSAFLVLLTLRMCSSGFAFPFLLWLIASVALSAGLVFPAASASQARSSYRP